MTAKAFALHSHLHRIRRRAWALSLILIGLRLLAAVGEHHPSAAFAPASPFTSEKEIHS
jgi:hypothetical protein